MERSMGVVCHIVPGTLRATAMAAVTLVLWCASTATGADEQPPVVRIADDMQRVRIGSFVELVEDPSGEWTVTDAAREDVAYRRSNSPTLNLGLTSSDYWLRFRLEQSDSIPASYAIDLGSWCGSMLYCPSDPDAFEPTGVVNRYRLSRDFRGPAVFYAKVGSEAGLHVPIEIGTEVYLGRRDRGTSVLWGLYYGLLAAMVLVNLFAFSALRDRSYLWYVLHVTLIGLFFARTNRLIPDIPSSIPIPGADNLTYVIFGCMVAVAAQFGRSFLLTRRNSPVWDKILMGTGVFGIVLVTLSLLTDYRILNQVSSTFAYVAPLAVIGAGVACWRRGFRPARLYLLAWGLFSVGGVVHALVFRGTLPFSGLTYYAWQVGSAFEAVLLALAMGDRIRALEWYRVIIENTPDMVVVHRRGRVQFANRAAAEGLGYGDPARMMGIPVLDLIAPNQHEEARDIIRRVEEDGEVIPRFEMEARRVDGSVRYAETPGIPIIFRGEDAVLAVVRDITDQKRAAQDRERLITDLTEALAQVKTLHGLLPICAHCKKVRADTGYWQRIESYLSEHSDAELTHSICPECAEKLYPTYARDARE